MYNTTERELLDLYESIYNQDTETNDLIIKLCESCEYGTDLEDRSEFAQVIIEDDCIFEFLELVADDFGIDIIEILSEEVYLTEDRNKAILNALRAVGMMSGVLKTPAKQAASKAVQRSTSKATSGTLRQGKLLTNKGTAQNFTKGRTPFTGTDPVPAASSPLPKVKQPAPSAPGQKELNLRTTPGAGRREVASSGGISSKGGSRMGPDGSKGTALPGRITTPKSTGGLLGTRNIPRPGAGLPRQAPRPAWGPGGTGGPGLPRPPRQPGGAMAKRGSSSITTPGGAMAKRGSSSITTPGVQKVRVKDMGPTGRSTADKGARTLKGDGVIDVTAKTVSSRKTTSQFLKDLARAARNNKGKVAGGAAIAGGAALGLATGDGKRTASRDTAPTTPSTPPASKGKTGTGMANIPPAEGLVNNPNYGKPGTSTSKDKSPTSKDKSPTSKDKSTTSKDKSPTSKDKSTTSKDKSPTFRDKPPTLSTKKDETKAKINKEYDRLRGKDPKTGIVKGSSESQAKAAAYARRENERIYGKNYAKPKTPNPLMKGFRKEDYYHEISEYLISEGFASSESNASRIISVMSQAWVDQIVESSCGGGHSKKKKKKKGY